MARLEPGPPEPDIAGDEGKNQKAGRKAEPAAHPQVTAAAAAFLENDDMIFAEQHGEAV